MFATAFQRKAWRGAVALAAIASILATAACAAYTPPEVATQSVSSTSGTPAGRYRAVVVFVENVDQTVRLTAEEAIVSKLKRSGVRAQSSLELFNYSQSIDDVSKANIIQSNGFDAALFVYLVRADTLEKPAPGISQGNWNGVPVFCGNWSGGQWCKSPELTEYSLDSQGHVVTSTSTVVTQSTLEDVRTAQRVWAGETTATVNAKFGNAEGLYDLAARNVVAKLQQDRVI